MRFRMVHKCNATKKWQIGVLLGLLEVQNEAIPTVPPEGQTEEWKALKPLSRQQMCQNGHNAVRKAYGSLGGKWEMGQERE
jgi:hypothetical protein